MLSFCITSISTIILYSQLKSLGRPCLSMCIFGLFNIIYNLKAHFNSDIQKPSISPWSSSSISALSLAAISILIYTLLALLTYRKINIVRMRDAMHRHTPHGDYIQLLPEHEQQRQQLLRLLRECGASRGVSPEASQSTFRIDLPQNLRRSTTIISTPDSVYEAQPRSYTPISDRLVNPSIPHPIPHLSPNPVINQNQQLQLPDASFDLQPINMGGDYFVHGADGVPHNSDSGKSITGYPKEKVQEAYGGTMLLVNGERHPLERERARYHFETVEEQERRRSREGRRAEIEMGSRVPSKGIAKIEGVAVTPRIARVETEGWGTRH